MILILLKILAIIFNVGDYITTVISFKYGCKEANPIARWLFKHKLAFIMKVGLFSYWIWASDYMYFYAIIIFSIVCINNLLVIRKTKRLLNKYNLEYKNGTYIFKG